MIIGFAGKAATGKTTAAKHLAPRLDREAVILPMAKVLRDEVEDFLGQVGAAADVRLIHGSQEDKVTVFYIDEQQALGHCPCWADYLTVNRDIQDRPGRSAVTARRILQWWGTEYRRAQDPDYWVKAWARKARQYDHERMHLLVDDVRFMNELSMLQSLGGLVVKIERPGFDGANNHSSENALDDFTAWDRVLVNDGTLVEFLAKVEALAKELPALVHAGQG